MLAGKNPATHTHTPTHPHTPYSDKQRHMHNLTHAYHSPPTHMSKHTHTRISVRTNTPMHTTSHVHTKSTIHSLSLPPPLSSPLSHSHFSTSASSLLGRDHIRSAGALSDIGSVPPPPSLMYLAGIDQAWTTPDAMSGFSRCPVLACLRLLCVFTRIWIKTEAGGAELLAGNHSDRRAYKS